MGRRPDPGLALLRLALGDGRRPARPSGARSTRPSPIARAGCSSPSRDHARRRRRSGGRSAAARARRLAEPAAPPLLRAIAAQADGLVRLAAGDARGALVSLRGLGAVAGTRRAVRGRARPRVDRPRPPGAGRRRRRGDRVRRRPRGVRRARGGPDRARVDETAGDATARAGRAEPARARGPATALRPADEPGDR